MLGANAKKFEEYLQEILKYEKDNLIERDSWGDTNFRKYKNDIDEIFFFVNEFSRLDISFIPDDYFPQVNEIIAHIAHVIDIVDSYNISAWSKQEINSKCNTLKINIDKLKPFWAMWLPILAYKRGDIDEKIFRLDAIKLDASRSVNEIKRLQHFVESESTEILQAMRETSASSGVAVFNQDFQNAAVQNKTDAKYWGCLLGVFALVTILFPIIVFIWPPDYKDLIALVSSKILVMAVLITASLWLGRMYKSAKHQEAINMFKANALRTFQAFINATNDEQTKNAVLLETTKAIFTGFNPGYISTEQTINDSLKIMEVFKNIPQKYN